MPVIGLSSLPNSQPESNNTSNVGSALSQDEMLKAMLQEVTLAKPEVYCEPSYFDHNIKDVVPFIQSLV